jgi:hypothetical protein
VVGVDEGSEVASPSGATSSPAAGGERLSAEGVQIETGGSWAWRRRVVPGWLPGLFELGVAAEAAARTVATHTKTHQVSQLHPIQARSARLAQ